MEPRMPKGPKGERRPADTVQSAIKVARIATGEADEDRVDQRRAKGGQVGGKARAKALTAEKRQEIAKKAAHKRWES
jgi:hypothetical protein